MTQKRSKRRMAGFFARAGALVSRKREDGTQVADYNLKLDKDKIMEMPMVDLAFEVLKAKNQPLYYRDLMEEIAKIRGLSEEEVNRVIAQLYTEINIDGRFACVGGNVWGLKRWYPVEKADDQVVGGRYPMVINEEDDLEDEDLYPEEDAYLPEDEEEGYGLFDEERDELFDEGEETANLDEDVVLDDEPPVLPDELEEEGLADEFDDAEDADFDEDEAEEEDEDR